MSGRSYLSIGDVLQLLQEEFPDVTISKIRFLESQGLVNPERTPSGYRKFYDEDVERLRWVLRQQREHFLPLKVIKGRLDAGHGVEPPVATESGYSVDNGADNGHRYDADYDVPDDGGVDGRVDVGAHVAQSEAPSSGGLDRSAGWAAATRSSDLVDGRDGTVGNQNDLRGESPARTQGPVRAQSAARTPTAVRVPNAVRTQSTVGGLGSASGASSSDNAGRPPARQHGDLGVTSPTLGEWVPDDGRFDHEQPNLAGDTRGQGSGYSATGPRGAGTAPGMVDASTGQLPGFGSANPSPPPAEVGGSSAGGVTMGRTLDELVDLSGLDRAEIAELESFGLVSGRMVGGVVYYDDDEAAVATLAAAFRRFGVEPRHLRLHKQTVEREAGFIEQIILPLVKQRNPDAHRRAAETVVELGQLGQALRAALLRRVLRDRIG